MSTLSEGNVVPRKYLNRVVFWIEVVVAGLLVVLTALAVISLVVETFHVVFNAGLLTHREFTAVISTILEVFILIELFRIALAYMAHENVIPTVLEAALVAVARKFVVYEPTVVDPFLPAVGLASLLVAVGVAWWLLARSNACDIHE